ncbi:BMP-binding endothelial regulator protein [Cimex lectularius]|uniref:BMP-binding endothelial regulator protein n=1 Tax=Cimex lectularius TaxID=79782 RepID=A0A8I6RHN3_CIMLE|nr:BMP-binding endothelial regulator protein [Cimex lectularius]
MKSFPWLGVLTWVSLASANNIIGSREACSNEGELVNVESIKDIRCFTCMCKNGFVECQKEQCPSQEGCHMLLEIPKNGCCGKCKGCIYKGVEYDSGVEWRDPDNPCKVFTCRGGVVTDTIEQCFTPCNDPFPPLPGQCCPTCSGCRVNGQTVVPGRTVRSMEDPCLKCHCSNGKVSCAKKACPVVHCSPSSVLPPGPGECCPSCQGSRKLMLPPQGKCILGTGLHEAGRSFMPDHCTICECVNGTSVCSRPSCPVLDCPLEKQELKPNSCCPHCSPKSELSNTCKVGDLTYEDGETWQVDLCKSCVCKEGSVRCAAEMCPQQNKACPPNQNLVHLEGQCCPKCVESDGVCTVFGDPHYKTFDGKFYSFQGSCKYLLAADRVNNTFSIRVTNDARNTKTSSWTKTVSIKVDGIKINLGEKRRVKINGKRVFISKYGTTRNGIHLSEADDSVLVETQQTGLKVLWDGNSFLEVSVPAKYKGKLEGLCGNFNSKPGDDMTSRWGEPIVDPDKFGNSWRVGGRRACSRGTTLVPKQQGCFSKTGYQRRQKERLCKILRSRVFAPCHKYLNYVMYYKSCLVDMCECPSNMCYCESFTAYAHECARLGATLHDWKKETSCQARH